MLNKKRRENYLRNTQIINNEQQKNKQREKGLNFDILPATAIERNIILDVLFEEYGRNYIFSSKLLGKLDYYCLSGYIQTIDELKEEYEEKIYFDETIPKKILPHINIYSIIWDDFLDGTILESFINPSRYDKNMSTYENLKNGGYLFLKKDEREYMRSELLEFLEMEGVKEI